MNRRTLLVLSLFAVVVSLGAGALVMLSPGEQMTDAASRFLASLSDKQKEAALMDFDDKQRVDWHFIPKKARKGLKVGDMTDKQRRAAFSLLRAALSETGYTKARTVMDLEGLVHVLEGDRRRWDRDPLKYYFTVFGQPDKKSKWGLSVEGHHLSLNFVIENNEVVSHTPAFYGTNPNVVVMDVGKGPAMNTYVLEREEINAFDLLHALNADQKAKAIIAAKSPRDIRDAGSAQAPADEKVGLPASEMNEAQMHRLWYLIWSHAENMPKPIAEARMKEIADAGMEKIHFAWAGADKPGVGHYYRVQGPTFLIEFCNTQPDAAGNPAAHPHSVWRDMRGDFGIKRK